MLDIKFIKEHLEQVKKNITDRNMVADADLVVKLYDEKTALQQKLDSLRQQRNENAAKMKGKLEQDVRTALIAEGKKLKEDIAALEKDYEEAEKAFKVAMMDIPNMAHPMHLSAKRTRRTLRSRSGATSRSSTSSRRIMWSCARLWTWWTSRLPPEFPAPSSTILRTRL